MVPYGKEKSSSFIDNMLYIYYTMFSLKHLQLKYFRGGDVRDSAGDRPPHCRVRVLQHLQLQVLAAERASHQGSERDHPPLLEPRPQGPHCPYQGSQDGQLLQIFFK
jgi:hypothetical protein